MNYDIRVNITTKINERFYESRPALFKTSRLRRKVGRRKLSCPPRADSKVRGQRVADTTLNATKWRKNFWRCQTKTLDLYLTFLPRRLSAMLSFCVYKMFGISYLLWNYGQFFMISLCALLRFCVSVEFKSSTTTGFSWVARGV